MVFPFVISVSILSLSADIRSLFVSALERIVGAKGAASIQNTRPAPALRPGQSNLRLGFPQHLSGFCLELENFQMRLPWAVRIQSQFPAA